MPAAVAVIQVYIGSFPPRENISDYYFTPEFIMWKDGAGYKNGCPWKSILGKAEESGDKVHVEVMKAFAMQCGFHMQ